MGRRWGLLDSQAKLKYEAAFTSDKARYEEEMKNYQPSQQFLEMKAKEIKIKTEVDNYFSFLLSSWRKLSVEQPGLGAKEVQQMIWMQWSKGKMGRKAVDPDAPKKPRPAFFLFQRKMRRGVGLGRLSISYKALTDMWNNIDEEGKKLYKEEEEEGKKKYVKEVMDYKKSNEEVVEE